MTRVSFYIFKDPAAVASAFICKLAEKIYGLGQPIFILCDTDEELASMDRELWTYRQGSFLPHERFDGTDAEAAPILLGTGEPPARPREVLINLGVEVPECFSSFTRCVELVCGDDAQRAAARRRYRFYRDRGYELDSHQI